MKYLVFLLFNLLFLITGCSTSSDTTGDGDGLSQVKKIVISPAATNPDITKGTDDYYIYMPATKKAKDNLLIFLPGSLVKPKVYQDILQTGAENGYFSVGLSYQNKFTLTGQCKNEGPDCTGNVSREELEGKDYSDKVKVSRASSIEGRIIALLKYLQQKYPAQKWDQFLDGQNIRWGDIIIAGHSQGSSHAAYIGWHRPVARVGMFSGPHNVANEQGEGRVSWLNDGRKTPASKFYGFGNTKDHVTDFALQRGAWTAMGLKGPVTSVDGTSSPFGNSHQLSTSVGRGGIINGAHGSTAADANTPHNEQGKPIFKPVWEYMLFK